MGALLLLLHPLLLPRWLPLTPGRWKSPLGRSLVPGGKFSLASLAKGRARAVVSKAPSCPFGDGAGVRRRVGVGRPALAAQKSHEFWCCSAGGWPEGRQPRCVGARHPKSVAVQRAGRCLRSFWGVLARGGQSARKGGEKTLVWGGWSGLESGAELPGQSCWAALPVAVLPHASSAAFPTLARTRSGAEVSELWRAPVAPLILLRDHSRYSVCSVRAGRCRGEGSAGGWSEGQRTGQGSWWEAFPSLVTGFLVCRTPGETKMGREQNQRTT